MEIGFFLRDGEVCSTLQNCWSMQTLQLNIATGEKAVAIVHIPSDNLDQNGRATAGLVALAEVREIRLALEQMLTECFRAGQRFGKEEMEKNE